MGAAIERTSVETSPKLKTELPHGPAILFTAAKIRIILAAYQRMSG